MDYRSLGFSYYSVGAVNVRYYFKDGSWSKPEYTKDEYLPIHMAASCLHYGLELFEGLKVYKGVDNKVRIFRPSENGKRMLQGSRKLWIPEVPVDMFVEACIEVVKRNISQVPPSDSGASLYLRPLLLCTRGDIAVRSFPEAMFVVFATPVGPYFKNGIVPVSCIVDRTQDRSAPLGTGDVKAGGNYASSMYSYFTSHNLGYDVVLYTDPMCHRYVEECGAANFYAIRDNSYFTPISSSILPSITNDSIQTVCRDLGIKVEKRKVEISELDTFSEAAACGTGAIISPIGSIYDPDFKKRVYYGDTIGNVSKKLYDILEGIHYGRVEDTHNWCVVL